MAGDRAWPALAAGNGRRGSAQHCRPSTQMNKHLLAAPWAIQHCSTTFPALLALSKDHHRHPELSETSIPESSCKASSP